MAFNLGPSACTPYVGDQFASLYVGEERVPTVPGKPVIISSESGFTSNVIHEPVSDTGGTSVTGYKYFFNGVRVIPIANETLDGNIVAGFIQQNLDGQVVRMLASNAVGDGSLSAPLTVTAG
jgi:hypothetical protein